MENEKNLKYDLEERTSVFAENIIKLCKSIKVNDLSRPIILQLIRAATSVGANYMEANGACSKKDFKNKIFICKKEAQETKYWLRLLKSFDVETDAFWREAQELSMIFHAIASKV